MPQLGLTEMQTFKTAIDSNVIISKIGIAI